MGAVNAFLSIQDEVKDTLNFLGDGVSADFTPGQIRNAINNRYVHEVNMARENGGQLWFRAIASFSWAAADVTVTLTTPALDKQLTRIFDITSSANTPVELVVGDRPERGDIWWKDRSTLQWGSAGPGSARTIRVEYIADAGELVSDTDEPVLIVPAHRYILVWSTCKLLRLKADERVPSSWDAELEEARLSWWKELSRGRPYSNMPMVNDVSSGDSWDF